MAYLRKRYRIPLILGGFLIFIGLMIVGVFCLVLIRAVDVEALEGIFENADYRMLFLGTLIVIGILDVVSGIILRAR